MATVNLFSIELAGESETFTPGSTISGIVRVSTTTVLSCSRITLRAVGKAHIIFSIIPDEIYFDFQYLLWHSIKKELLPGHYEFPFVFNLPLTCPPSFDGGFGSVRYGITAEIEQPWWFNKRKTITFKVAPKLDLALSPILARPHTILEKQNTWFSNKMLKAMVNINRRAFTRSDTVALSMNITNERSSTVKAIETGILTVAQVASSSIFGTHDFDAVTCKSHFLKRRTHITSGTHSNFDRSIPLLHCLPTITKSNLFRVRHFVYVKIKSGFFSSPLIVTTQILIYDNVVNELQPLSSQQRIYPPLSTGNSLAAIASGTEYGEEESSDKTCLLKKYD